MILRVTRYGEAVLRQVGEPVVVFDAALEKLAADMIETMYAAEGIGLAAQQIGLARQMCVVDLSLIEEEDLDYELDGRRTPIDLIMPMALINPVVTVLPGTTLAAEEGCLSFPAIRADIPRAQVIQVSFQDVKGVRHELRCAGWFARVVQHEVDHLNGILFIDHLDRRTLRLLEPRLKRLKERVERTMHKDLPEDHED